MNSFFRFLLILLLLNSLYLAKGAASYPNEDRKLSKLKAKIDSLFKKNGKLRKANFISSIEKLGHLVHIHKIHKEINDSHEKKNGIVKIEDWNTVKNISEEQDLKGQFHLDTNYQVFGFHPYWMGTAYKAYNYSLLSILSYFSYELDPFTGNAADLNHWETSDIVEVAKKANPKCKVLLTVTNFGYKNNELFLRNPKARISLIQNLIKQLSAKNADGVTIDFEEINESEKQLFADFILQIKKEFQKQNKKYTITVTLPAVDILNAYDAASIAASADYLIVMAYQFYCSTSRQAGPVAPLLNSPEWGEFSVHQSVQNYLDLGIKPKQIILSVPYYGLAWNTNTKDVPGLSKGFIGYRTYNTIKTQLVSQPILDEASLSVFHSYNMDDAKIRQIWFEDTISLGFKYDYIKDMNLGGAGIWALGYDNGFPDLWNLLKNKFGVVATSSQNGTSSSTVISGNETTANGATNKASETGGKKNDTAGGSKTPTTTPPTAVDPSAIWNIVKKFPHTLSLVFKIVFMAILVGMFSSISSIDVRRAIIDKKTQVMILLALLLVVVNLCFYNDFDFYLIAFNIALLLSIAGFITFYILDPDELP